MFNVHLKHKKYKFFRNLGHILFLFLNNTPFRTFICSVSVFKSTFGETIVIFMLFDGSFHDESIPNEHLTQLNCHTGNCLLVWVSLLSK